MINVKKTLAALLAVALCTVTMAGCDRKKTSVSENDPTGQSDKVFTDAAATVGESKTIDGVEVSFSKVFEPRKASEGKQFVLVEVLVNNKTDSKIKIDCYEDFICKINGEATHYRDFLTAKASKACTDYAHENNSDIAFLQGDVESGKTFKGYYPMELSDDWKTVELRFVPFADTSDNAVLLVIKPDMVTAAS